MLSRIIITFFLSAILLLVLWLFRGALLTPVVMSKNTELMLILSVSGFAPELQNTVESLEWLIHNGTLRCSIYVKDDGMDEQTRSIADIMQREGKIKLIS